MKYSTVRNYAEIWQSHSGLGTTIKLCPFLLSSGATYLMHKRRRAPPRSKASSFCSWILYIYIHIYWFTHFSFWDSIYKWFNFL